MEAVTVRQESDQDADAIEVVNRSAFGGDGEARLVRAIRQSRHFIPELSLVAELGGRLAGHILMFRIRLEKTGGGVQEMLALAPMSVVPSQSHRGIGSSLVRAAIAKAASLGHKVAVVVGYPEYYQRFGFKKASTFHIHCPLPVAADDVSVLELVAGSLREGGTLVYPPEFARMFRGGGAEGEQALVS